MIEYIIIPYNTLHGRLSNEELNKLKSWIKYGTQVTIDLSRNVIGDSNDEDNFPHKLFLSNIQVSKISKASANASTDNINFEKPQLSKMIKAITNNQWKKRKRK